MLQITNSVAVKRLKKNQWFYDEEDSYWNNIVNYMALWLNDRYLMLNVSTAIWLFG